MFTLEKNNRKITRTLFIYVSVTLFVALFGFIYELNSNNVFAFEMAFAWIYPLIFGVGTYLTIRLIPVAKAPSLLTACVYNTGVGLITVRSIFIGVIKIYGTTNNVMTSTYTILSIVFLVGGVILYILGLFLPKKETND